MPRVSMNVPMEQIESLVQQLPMPIKLRLVRRLEQATWGTRWDALITKLQLRAKRRRLTGRAIQQLCEKVRQEVYENSRSRR